MGHVFPPNPIMYRYDKCKKATADIITFEEERYKAQRSHFYECGPMYYKVP